jgi:lipopolysaccharide transport system permease protein
MSTIEVREKPLVEVLGGQGVGVTRDSMPELWRFREVLVALVARQVRVKYKQAAIGIGWSVLQPVLSAALFALFVGRLAHLSSDTMPYFLFALAGMVVWNGFSSATSGAMESLVTNQVMLRKVYFPREILPLSTVGAALVDFLPALASLCVVAFLYGNTPSVEWLVLPLVPLLVALFAAAVGLTMSALNVYYRDVRYTLPFLLQLGLFASPIIYPLSVVPGAWRTVYAVANPVAAAIDVTRRAITGEWPEIVPTAGAALWSLTLACAGYVLFKRLERGFSDRV